MKLSKKIALVSVGTVLAVSAFASAAFANVIAPNGMELKDNTVYRISPSVSCPVVAGPVSADFGSGLVTGGFVKPLSNGSILCGLSLGTTKGAIMGVSYEGFVSTTGPVDTFNGYKDAQGNWQESAVIVEDETCAGQGVNKAVTQLPRAEAMVTYLYTGADGKLLNSYDLALYINNTMKPTQFGNGSDYGATLSIDWDKTTEIIGSLTTSKLTVDTATCKYTGSAIEPAVTVSLDGKTLVKDTDYTVTYKDNTNVGTATATVTGIGVYAGSTSADFTIEKADVDMTGVVMSDVTATYDGAEHAVVATNLPEGVTASYMTTGVESSAYLGNSATDPGVYTVTANFTADENHNAPASMSATLTIEKVASSITAKAYTRTVKQSKKATYVYPITVTKAQGKVTYAKKSGASCLSINKSTGKVTVKKNTKKGTYTAVIVLTSAGNNCYLGATKNIKITVKVK